MARDLIHPPDLAPRLEEPGHDLAGLFLEIGVISRVAQSRGTDLHALHRLGHDVEMLTGLQRDVDADLGCEMSSPHSGREYDSVRLYLALFGDDPGDPTVRFLELGDRHTLDEPGATHLCALCQSHRRVDGRGLSVSGNVQHADEIVGAHQRPKFRSSIEVDDLGVDSHTFGHGGAAEEFLPPLVVVSDRYRARSPVPRCLIRLVFQLFEQTGRVRCELRERVGRLQL